MKRRRLVIVQHTLNDNQNTPKNTADLRLWIITNIPWWKRKSSSTVAAKLPLSATNQFLGPCFWTKLVSTTNVCTITVSTPWHQFTNKLMHYSKRDQALRRASVSCNTLYILHYRTTLHPDWWRDTTTLSPTPSQVRCNAHTDGMLIMISLKVIP